MIPPDELGQYPTGDYTRIEELSEQLSDAWKEYDGSGPVPDLAPLLDSCGKELRLAVLYELIKTEMPFRSQNALPWELDYYLETYPELGGTDNLSANLILEECLVRKMRNMRVSVTSYKKRFPQQFDKDPDLARRLEKEGLAGKKGSVSASAPAAASSAIPLRTSDPFNREVVAGKIIADHFIVQGVLGDGGYGKVYKVLDTKGNIEKALKIISHPLDTDAARMELDALEKIKNLKHPFILLPESFWVEQERGQLVILMELASGGNLRECLAKHQKEGKSGIPVQELLGYVKDAADALDYLQRQKIVHRDIKPENILLIGDHAMVADLGAAKLLHHGRTTSAPPLGSLPFMAPEVFRNSVSRRSDQYSLVVTYAELRQGKRVFKGKSWGEFYEAHTSGTPNLDAKLSQGERDVILRGLSKDPAARFASCLEFVESLKHALPRKKRRRKAEPVGVPGEPTIAIPKEDSGPGGDPSSETPSTNPPGSGRPNDGNERENPHPTLTTNETDLSMAQQPVARAEAARELKKSPTKHPGEARSPGADTDPPFKPEKTPHHPQSSYEHLDDFSDSLGTIGPSGPMTPRPDARGAEAQRSPHHAPLTAPKPMAAGQTSARGQATTSSPATSSYAEAMGTTTLRPAASGGNAGKVIIGMGAMIGLVAALVVLVLWPFGPQEKDEPKNQVVAKVEPKPIPPKVPQKTEEPKEPKEDKIETPPVVKETKKDETPVPVPEVPEDAVLVALKKLNRSIDDHKTQNASRATFDEDRKALFEQKEAAFAGPRQWKEAWYRSLYELADQFAKDNATLGQRDLFLLEDGQSYVDDPSAFRRAMAKFVESSVLTWPKNDDGWKARLADCEKADPTNSWVKACRQECVLEAPALLLGKSDDKFSEVYLAEIDAGDAAYSYARYVLALSKAKNTSNRIAAADILLALIPTTAKCLTSVQERRERSANLLQEAGASLRDENDLFYQDDRTKADKTYRYLLGAGKWLSDGDMEKPNLGGLNVASRQTLAMAALTKRDADWEIGADLATKALTDARKLAKQERQFFTLVTADSYQRIRQELAASRSAADKSISLDDWKTIIDPALSVASTKLVATNPVVAKRQALWLAAKGWLMRVHPDQRWAAEDAKEEAFLAYDEACSIAAKVPDAFTATERGEFLAGKVFAAAQQAGIDEMTPEQWAPLEKLARAAVEFSRTGGRQSSSDAALALALRNEAWKERALGPRLEKYKSAYDFVTEAIKKAPAIVDEDDATLFFLHSNICLEYGNNVQKKMYLSKEAQTEKNEKELADLAKPPIAAAFASAKAVYEASLSHPSPARLALAYGFALEDVEYINASPEKADYQRAIDVLKNAWAAVKAGPKERDYTLAQFPLTIGRCYYRWSESSRDKAKVGEFRSEAQKNFRQTIADPLAGAHEVAEGHYWLAKCLLGEGSPKASEEASTEFKTAIEVAANAKGRDKAASLNWSIMSKAEQFDLEMKDALEDIRKAAKNLAASRKVTDDPKEAAKLKDLAATNYSDAVKRCDSAREKLSIADVALATDAPGDYLFEVQAGKRAATGHYYRALALYSLSSLKTGQDKEAKKTKALEEVSSCLKKINERDVIFSAFHLTLVDLEGLILDDGTLGNKDTPNDRLVLIKQFLSGAAAVGRWAHANPSKVSKKSLDAFRETCTTIQTKLATSPDAQVMRSELTDLRQTLALFPKK